MSITALEINALALRLHNEGGQQEMVEWLFQQAENAERVAKRAGYKVKCNETGVVYESQAAAAKAMKVTPARMSKHLNGVRHFEHIRDHTFERVE